PVIFIELAARSPYKDLGYPELLVDRNSYDYPDLTGYSYAYYKENQLVQRVGEYAYGLDLLCYLDTTIKGNYFEKDRMDHFLYRIDINNTLLISKRTNTLLNAISPFSYLLIFLFIIAFLVFCAVRFKDIRSLTIRSLRNRLQAFMLGLILSSFVIVGILMMVYLIRLNNEKNEENLLERALSILIETEHKFGQYADLNAVGQEDLENMLIKFANVFFSDINLYSPEGILIASSRPRIFQEGLISDRINRQAFDQIATNKSSMFAQTECIGKLSYLSAYVPFYNNQNRLLAYLNLPYFSRQDDLKREISTFLVAFINIYVLFLLLGVVVTYLVSNYITSPLKLLALRIRRIQIGKLNDKLEWKQEDEIGKLVEEYNRMLDELATSAEKLAVSERASAWREMAQQVAHEIKNPLTPMKLSIQYLQKAWDEHAPDWEQRLKRFADALVEQIDSLSAIASEFSFFAKMPEPDNEILDLDELVQTSLGIYKDVSSINLAFYPSENKKWVFADRKQLLRVFSNLVNNAIQATEDRSDGRIILKTESTGETHVLEVADNGKGISREQADKIFQPNFTTRSGGAGLGLAIVKGIILAIGGEISFRSEPGSGTTFQVLFPAAHPTVHNTIDP
ncbi:MAG: ATP-binding protein, partial [bacterium]